MNASISGFLERSLSTNSSENIRDVHRTTLKLLLGLLASGLWGAAAACANMHLAVANLFKLPMVVLLSMLTALPLALTLRNHLRLQMSWRELLIVHAYGTAAASTVLGAFAPLVAIYARTSANVSMTLTMLSAGIAMFTGAVVLLLRMRQSAKTGELGMALFIALTLILVQAAAALQLVSLATPILPQQTAFGRGIDGFVNK